MVFASKAFLLHVDDLSFLGYGWNVFDTAVFVAANKYGGNVYAKWTARACQHFETVN